MRNFSCPAIILNVFQSGENNRTVTFFSPPSQNYPIEGISYATLYGGPKSKLRSLVSPMNAGILYFYRDEQKEQIKITDFDVKKYHLSFRENLFKTFAANLSAEILIKTKCAGSPEETWKIENGLLDGMELSDEEESRAGLVRFLWRYLEILGVKPGTAFCCQCGESLHSRKFTQKDLSSRYIYEISENGFVCPDCNSGSGTNGYGRFTLTREALTYLEAVSNLLPKEVRKIRTSPSLINEIKSLVYFLIEQVCTTKLKSLESGIGIL